MRRRFAYLYLVMAVGLAACGGSEQSIDCEEVDGTFSLIQQVFENRGCTASTCHGADDPAAGLDLRDGNAFDSLVNVDATSGDFARVFPADEELSVLYLKLAAKTLGTDIAALGITGSEMPTNSDVLTEDELELVRAWIRGGAPRAGVVDGTPKNISCGDTLGDVTPNKVPAPDPPGADKGIQFVSGGWALPAESEDEVCYVTYYDYADRVPEEFQLPCPEAYGGSERACFAYDVISHIQDPQSHHSIIESYIPPSGNEDEWNPKSPVWKDWQCVGGDRAGQPCDPTNEGECGPLNTCATAPLTSLGCTGYENGPEELGTLLGFFGQASTRQNVAVAQEATFRERYPEGVYGVVPVEGFMIWNSHSFNLTKFDTTVSQYINFEYIAEEDRRFIRQDLTVLDNIFSMGVIPPFESYEGCATFTLPVGSRLLTLSTHTHQFGRDFRVWYPPNEPCGSGFENGAIDERLDCDVPEGDPDYRSFTYQDPLYQRFDAENNLPILDSPGVNDRTFRYCAIWDNGATNPMEVRRHSERPDANTCSFGIFSAFINGCGCEPSQRACLGGDNEGMGCNGDDSVCGEAGACDACPVWGGVTTEEEMFGILGAFYVQE
ncbi:MAG: hypothetical protein AAF500_08215 [Myxococcota bacterium]